MRIGFLTGKLINTDDKKLKNQYYKKLSNYEGTTWEVHLLCNGEGQRNENDEKR
jgi:hypothetical protein